ncbi:MAG TPA: Hsp70 family protein, partial [Dehalococcoidia bacterium]|nr:Hsp70 family protein [Dehalococcoidia bacterium]
MLSIGVDFGTSNSSVAVYDGTHLRLLDVDPQAPDPRVMRSLIYFERSGEMHFGRRALSSYLEQNTGRPVRYEMRRVGEIQMTFAEIGTLVKDAFALIDVNEPGRLFQSLKRFLPVTYFQATNVFGRDYTVEELLSLLAREIISASERLLGEPVEELTVGWPVRFSDDPRADQLARNRAKEAWRLAGARSVTFVEEPV